MFFLLSVHSGTRRCLLVYQSFLQHMYVYLLAIFISTWTRARPLTAERKENKHNEREGREIPPSAYYLAS